LDGLLCSNQGVNTGLSVATVSTPLVYSWFWMLAFVQLEAVLAALLLLPPLAVLLDEVLPQAATTEPMSVVAAAATMMRRI
jgi:hypothetical protein